MSVTFREDKTKKLRGATTMEDIWWNLPPYDTSPTMEAARRGYHASALPPLGFWKKSKLTKRNIPSINNKKQIT
jgi:hypothetical protein